MTTPDTVVNLGDASPRRLLVTWANQQDAWLRALTTETILSRQEVSDDALARIFGTFLAEKGLSDDPASEVPTLEIDHHEVVADESLELCSIRGVHGVNALAEGQDLQFDPDLTVLFGQNGSGKTGYARILKRISAVRTPEDILPNAHADAAQPAPSADITFQIAGQQQVIHWQDEPGLAPFTRISVFDAAAVAVHVDSELGYVFTPAELALFSHVSTGMQRIQQLIAAEVAELRPGSNPLLQRFARGTTVYPVVESLGATTELSELNELATLPTDAEDTQARLQEEIGALRGNTLETVLASAQQSQRDLARILGVIVAVRDFNADAYTKAQESLEAAQERRREAREMLFSASELPGPPDEDWQRLVVAGDTYRQHLGLALYPQDGDACLYCMQPLGSVAKDLLSRYRTFLDETLVEQVAAATARLDAALPSVDPTSLLQATEYVEAQQQLDTPPAWALAAASLLSRIRTLLEEARERGAVTDPALSSAAQPLAVEIATLHESTRAAAIQLADQKANAETLLIEKQQELAELSARIELKRHLATARDFVQRAKRAQRLEQLSRGISNGAAKQLTMQSKLASEDLVNKNFETLFADECARLRAPQVALRFQGRSGKAERKKVVATYKPSAVLSEGEQKVLAIADFLAESRMRGTKAPLIFDDPVTSLDYRRLDEVAARILELADTHQVIVLTHNIMFASALLAGRQSKKQRVKVYEVRDGGAAKGILAPDIEPRLDTVADLAKRINTKLKAIPGTEPVVEDALIKETYDLIRAWCEAFVEQELLQNVTQRYRANIMMSRLEKIDTARLDAAIAVIAPMFERACDRMTGHSHALEYMSTKPTLAELQEDWRAALAARAAYIAT